MNTNYNNMNYQNYNGNSNSLSYYIKKFLLVFLAAVVTIFILLWLFPTKSGLKDAFQEMLNPLYDRMYQENLDTMKEAAILYYTTDRLPKEENSSKKMTLGEMLEKNLLLQIKDKNGNICSSEDSYVEITKENKEYKLKVNLKCGEEEKFIITYLGCYSYCESDICEKKTKQIVQTVTSNNGGSNIIDRVVNYVGPKKHYCEVINNKYYDGNGKVVSKSTYEASCENKKPATKYYCKIVNGKYYDKNGKVVNKSTYEKSCNKPTPVEKHYCKIVNGKYYDKNGNVVSKSEYEASCVAKPEIKHYCKIVDGKYYDKNGNVVSKSEYEKSCNKPEPEKKYYCKIVDGKYYDKNGNVVSKSEYEDSCTTKPEPEKYKYKYEKTEKVHHEKEYSEWTDWSDLIEYDPNNNNINWGKHELSWYEKDGYKTTTKYVPDKSNPIYATVTEEIGTYKQWACDEYDYFINTTTNTTYITSGANGGWVYKGTNIYKTVPASTNTTKYVFAGIAYSNCGTLCDVSPSYKFAIYERTATPTTTTSSQSSSSLEAVCKKVVQKDIPMSVTLNKIVDYNVKKETITTYYYHYKTRTILKEAFDETVSYVEWSYTKEDESLIKQGFKYTGIYVVVN